MSKGKIISMFEEEGRTDGTSGPVSMRRVLALLLALASVALFIIGFYFEKEGWYTFLPGIVCLAGSLLLLFFTTWEDVTEMIKTIKK